MKKREKSPSFCHSHTHAIRLSVVFLSFFHQYGWFGHTAPSLTLYLPSVSAFFPQHVAFVRFNNLQHLNSPATEAIGDPYHVWYRSSVPPSMLFTFYFPPFVCHYCLCMLKSAFAFFIPFLLRIYKNIDTCWPSGGWLTNHFESTFH